MGRSEEISFIFPLPSNKWQHKVQNNKWMAETWVPHRETEHYFATWFIIPLLCCSCQETSAAPKSDSASSIPCACWLQVLAWVAVIKGPGAALLQIHAFGQ